MSSNDLVDEIWQPLNSAAAASRQMVECLASREIDDGDLLEIAATLNDLVDKHAASPQRDKHSELMSFPWLENVYGSQPDPLRLDKGEEIIGDPFSVASGALHPSGIGLRVFKESEEGVYGVASAGRMFAGPPERVHGGIQAHLMDEMMGAVTVLCGMSAVTAFIKVNYRGPAPLEVPLSLRAWIDQIDGKKVFLKATGEAEGQVFVDAEALYIKVPPEKHQGI